jgi:hypothetical protein
MKARSEKGSLYIWLLALFIFFICIISFLIFMEGFYRKVALIRLRNYAAATALQFGRELADRGSFHKIEETDPAYGKATRFFLSNIWNRKINSPADIAEIREYQCYVPHEKSVFGQNPYSTENNCKVTGKIRKPIMSLRWKFDVDNYGYGVCCPSNKKTQQGNEQAQITEKDFCVNFNISGRIDPVFIGRISWFRQIEFIRVGNFSIDTRAVGLKDGKTVFLERISSVPCPATEPIID